MRRLDELEQIILPIVKGLGYIWVGLQYFPQGKRTLIRLYIDKPNVDKPNVDKQNIDKPKPGGGITLDDCERVSRQVDAVLSVENILQGEFTLEVSSPGIDRLFFTAEQCEDYIGKEITVRLQVPIEGRRNFKGILQRVEGDKICILFEGKELVLSFVDISEARLVPEW